MFERSFPEIRFYIPLTGLHNRLHFERKLNAAVKNGRKKSSRVALLFIDLDGFKGVNDSYGHAVSDTLLIAISKRLLQLFDKGDVVARMGGMNLQSYSQALSLLTKWYQFQSMQYKFCLRSV